MCSLNDEEIILLNNFIYINMDIQENELVGDVAARVIQCNDMECILKVHECLVVTTIEEWMTIFNNILKDKILSLLRIKNIKKDINGIKTASFVNNDNEAVVVFRGTSNVKEWDDNGKGAYEYDTEEQIEALNYVNTLQYEKIIVSGHSKGGNKAQYTAILSSKVEECVSINGQGFSNEFLKKYENEIKKNKYKIRAINSKNDYINCLFNCICGKCVYINTAYQKNPLFYHKANILLDENGKLNPICSRGKVAKIIHEFSVSLISELPEEVRCITIDGVIGAVEIILCGNDISEKFIKAVGGVIIMLIYGQYYFLKKQFISIYEGVKALTLPLLFWNDLIKAEDEKSSKLLFKTINNMKNTINNIGVKLNSLQVEKETDSIEFKINSAVNNAAEKLIELLSSKVILQ